MSLTAIESGTEWPPGVRPPEGLPTTPIEAVVDVTESTDPQWPLKLTADEQAAARLIPIWGRGAPVAWAVVDADVYPALNMWRWTLNPSGYAMRKLGIGGKSVNIRMHRVVMCLTPHDGMVIDHINHCRLDNRRCNLRYVNYSENNNNRIVQHPPQRTPAAPRWNKKDRRWVVSFQRNRVVYKVGTFRDFDEAQAALDSAVRSFDAAN